MSLLRTKNEAKTKAKAKAKPSQAKSKQQELVEKIKTPHTYECNQNE